MENRPNSSSKRIRKDNNRSNGLRTYKYVISVISIEYFGFRWLGSLRLTGWLSLQWLPLWTNPAKTTKTHLIQSQCLNIALHRTQFPTRTKYIPLTSSPLPLPPSPCPPHPAPSPCPLPPAPCPLPVLPFLVLMFNIAIFDNWRFLYD
jgi:hypothetical protein